LLANFRLHPCNININLCARKNFDYFFACYLHMYSKSLRDFANSWSKNSKTTEEKFEVKDEDEESEKTTVEAGLDTTTHDSVNEKDYSGINNEDESQEQEQEQEQEQMEKEDGIVRKEEVVLESKSTQESPSVWTRLSSIFNGCTDVSVNPAPNKQE